MNNNSAKQSVDRPADREVNSGGTAMLPIERRAASSLALIFGIRMLGLFIILPVFSLFASDYTSSTPVLIGLALGVYGLFQALLQIPFGLLSDRIGRKPVIAMGLLLFAVGSVIAASATDIYGVIIGRGFQGAGAVASVIMALASDLSREEQRTKMMASLGVSIGFAFMVSLVIGPILVNWLDLSGLFWLTFVAALLGIVVLFTYVPTPVRVSISGDTRPTLHRMLVLIRDPQLVRLDIGIFILHLMVSATFLAIPLSLANTGLSVEGHWKIYVSALMASIVVMIPLIILAEKYGLLRPVFLVSIAGLSVSQLIFWFASSENSLLLLFIGIVVFFSFFNTMEAMLPSLVSKLAPVDGKGSAMGVYSSSQFFGAFVGGVFGGWVYSNSGAAGLFFFMALITILWWFIAKGMSNPYGFTTQLVRIGKVDDDQANQLVELYSALVGVREAVVVAEEGIAYLRVDKKSFDPDVLRKVSV